LREKLEDAPRRLGMRRSSRGNEPIGCRGTCAACRCYGLLGRALRVRVGDERLAVEVYVYRFLAARRMPEPLRMDVRSWVLDSLQRGRLRAKDGWLRIDADTGRLRFVQGDLCSPQSSQ
jgi:hypothetical protein